MNPAGFFSQKIKTYWITMAMRKMVMSSKQMVLLKYKWILHTMGACGPKVNLRMSGRLTRMYHSKEIQHFRETSLFNKVLFLLGPYFSNIMINSKSGIRIRTPERKEY